MQFSVYPISMGMFNQKLELCQSPQDVKNSFGFLKNSNMTLSVFIKAVEFLITSFPDLDFKNWTAFSKKISQIFSNELKTDAMHSLQEKVLAKFREIYPHLSQSIAKNDLASFEKTEILLSEFFPIFEASAPQRIETAFEIENAKEPWFDHDSALMIVDHDIP